MIAIALARLFCGSEGPERAALVRERPYLASVDLAQHFGVVRRLVPLTVWKQVAVRDAVVPAFAEPGLAIEGVFYLFEIHSIWNKSQTMTANTKCQVFNRGGATVML